jgi:hypothetical protein
MFSLVVGNYGLGSVDPADGAGLHQFQDGTWVQVSDPDAFVIVPNLMGSAL